MADVTTQRARRSLGCGASRPVVKGWEVAEVTRLWLAEAPAADLQPFHASRRCRGAPIAWWKSRSTTEMIKRVWKNNGDKPQWRRSGGRHVQRQNEMETNKRWFMCGDCEKGNRKETERQEGMLLSSSFTGIASSEDFLPGRWPYPLVKTLKCLSNFSAVWLGSNILRSKWGNFTWKSSRQRSRMFPGGLKSRSESLRKHVRGFGRSI